MYVYMTAIPKKRKQNNRESNIKNSNLRKLSKNKRRPDPHIQKNQHEPGKAELEQSSLRYTQ